MISHPSTSAVVSKQLQQLNKEQNSKILKDQNTVHNSGTALKIAYVMHSANSRLCETASDTIVHNELNSRNKFSMQPAPSSC